MCEGGDDGHFGANGRRIGPRNHLGSGDGIEPRAGAQPGEDHVARRPGAGSAPTPPVIIPSPCRAQRRCCELHLDDAEYFRLSGKN